MKKAALFSISLVVCLSSNSIAQSGAKENFGYTNRPSIKAELASHLAHLLHRDLRSILGPIYDTTLENRTDKTQAFRRITAAHLARYAPPDSLIAVSARQYETSFSETELRGLIAFFSSPLGARYLIQQDQLVPAFQAEIARLLAPHQRELEQALANAIRAP